MIKRLKWNVLYGEESENDSGLSDGSDDSAAPGSENVQTVLNNLARNDPQLSSMLGLMDASSSSDEEDAANAVEPVVEGPATRVGKVTSDSHSGVKYAEWRECELCPGKRFLSDAEVELHLASKRHARAVRRVEALSSAEREYQIPRTVKGAIRHGNVPESTDDPMNAVECEDDADLDVAAEHEKAFPQDVKTPGAVREQQQSTTGQNASGPGRLTAEDQCRKAERRKAAAKRKLKALKRRKWEKKLKTDEVNDAEATSKISEEPSKPDTGEEVKGLTQRSSQKMKKKKLRKRKRRHDEDFIAEELQDNLNDEHMLSRSEAHKKSTKKKTKYEATCKRAEDTEPHNKKQNTERKGLSKPACGSEQTGRRKERVRKIKQMRDEVI